MIVEHATCVDWAGTGILLRGPSGGGKSDLALRLIDAGAQLVADDYVTIRVCSDRVSASAPEEISGLIEVRGIGIIRLPCCPETVIGLIVDLVPSENMERMPEAASEVLEGVAVDRVLLDPFEISCVAKIRMAMIKFAPAPKTASGGNG